MRHFYLFLTKQGLVPNNLLAALKPWDTPHKKAYGTFSTQEKEKILGAIDRNSPAGKRDYAIFSLANLEGMGFTVVPFGQGFKDISPPTKELMKLTLEKKLTHGGHPVLRWMMDNIYIRTDPAGNIKADKEKSTEKIDGAVATIIGLDRAIRCGNNTSASVYDDRGILFI